MLRSLTLATLTAIGGCCAPDPTPPAPTVAVAPPPIYDPPPRFDECLVVIPDVGRFGEAGDALFASWVAGFATVDYLGSASGWWVDQDGRPIGWSAAEDAALCVTVAPTPLP